MIKKRLYKNIKYIFLFFSVLIISLTSTCSYAANDINKEDILDKQIESYVEQNNLPQSQKKEIKNYYTKAQSALTSKNNTEFIGTTSNTSGELLDSYIITINGKKQLKVVNHGAHPSSEFKLSESTQNKIQAENAKEEHDDCYINVKIAVMSVGYIIWFAIVAMSGGSAAAYEVVAAFMVEFLTTVVEHILEPYIYKTKTELKKAEKDVNNANDSVNNKNKEREGKQKELDKLKEEEKNKQTELDKLKEEEKNKQTELDKLKEEETATKKKIEELEKDTIKNSDEISKLNKKLYEIKHSQGIISNEITQLTRRSFQLQSIINENIKKITGYNDQIKRLAGLDNELERVNERIKKIGEEYWPIPDKRVDKARRLMEEKRTLKKWKNDLKKEGLLMEDGKLNEEIIKTKTEAYQHAADKANNANKPMLEELESVHKQMAEKQSKLSSLENEVIEINNEIKETKNNIKTIKNEIKNLKNTVIEKLEKTKAEIKKIKQTISEVKDSVKQNVSKIKSTKELLKNIENELNKAKNILKEATENLARLKSFKNILKLKILTMAKKIITAIKELAKFLAITYLIEAVANLIANNVCNFKPMCEKKKYNKDKSHWEGIPNSTTNKEEELDCIPWTNPNKKHWDGIPD